MFQTTNNSPVMLTIFCWIDPKNDSMRTFAFVNRGDKKLSIIWCLRTTEEEGFTNKIDSRTPLSD